jgi:hypothetical protein
LGAGFAGFGFAIFLCSGNSDSMLCEKRGKGTTCSAPFVQGESLGKHLHRFHKPYRDSARKRAVESVFVAPTARIRRWIGSERSSCPQFGVAPSMSVSILRKRRRALVRRGILVMVVQGARMRRAFRLRLINRPTYVC